MSNFGRKAAMATVAFAAVGSTLFGGAALASDDEDHVKVTNTGGAGGAGGDATNNCVNLAVQVPILNILGDPSNAASCTATGGAGGAGGAGANF
jgi:hypothetical protein